MLATWFWCRIISFFSIYYMTWINKFINDSHRWSIYLLLSQHFHRWKFLVEWETNRQNYVLIGDVKQWQHTLRLRNSLKPRKRLKFIAKTLKTSSSCTWLLICWTTYCWSDLTASLKIENELSNRIKPKEFLFKPELRGWCVDVTMPHQSSWIWYQKILIYPKK